MLKTQSIRCQFTGAQGSLLDARLDMPRHDAADSFAIMSHCFTCTKETLTTSRISRGLAKYGIAVLRFDFSGLGDSQGNFADSNFSTMVKDILSAAGWLEQHYRAASTLIGHSMGGTAALLASTHLGACKSVVTLASPSEPSHVLHHFGKAMPLLEAGKPAEISVAGTRYPVKPQFIDDVRTYYMQQQLVAYNKPIMAVRAGQDELVRHQDADEILAYTNADTALLDLPSADHLFRNRQHTEQIIAAIAKWIKQH